MLLLDGCCCDRCGLMAESEGVMYFATFSDIKNGDLATGEMEQLHFCRQNGCAAKVRTPAMVAAKLKREKKDE